MCYFQKKIKNFLSKGALREFFPGPRCGSRLACSHIYISGFATAFSLFCHDLSYDAFETL